MESGIFLLVPKQYLGDYYLFRGSMPPETYVFVVLCTGFYREQSFGDRLKQKTLA